MRFGRSIVLAVVAVCVVVALALFVGSAAAQEFFLDTLVTGTITGATSGTVSVSSDTTMCTTIAGGVIVSDGTYQIVVNCHAGTGTLYVNGAATGATNDTATAPKNGNPGPSSGSSNAWIFVIAGVVAVLALGAGGLAAVRMRRKPATKDQGARR